MPSRSESVATHTLEELASRIGCTLPASAPADLVVRRADTLAEATRDAIAGCFGAAFAELAAHTSAGVVLCCPGAPATPPGVTRIELADEASARAALARAIQLLHGDRPWQARAPAGPGSCDATSYVAPGADVAASCTLMPFTYVGPGAEIGEGTVLEVGARVMDAALVGRRCLIGAGAHVGPGCILRDRVVLGPNAVVGSEGFGYQGEQGVPHVGRVLLEDDVSVGAGACIDRAVLGETVVREGTKLDNMVHVAHGVRIGPGCHIAAQSGIAGSAVLGASVEIGGQVGIADHARLGDGVQVAARSGVRGVQVSPGQVLGGYPAVPITEWRRTFAALRGLVRLRRQVAKLWEAHRRKGEES